MIRRANAYLEAGADCVFIPGIGDPAIIAALVNEINGPINILANANVPAASELERLGVRRLSVGAGAFRSGVKRGSVTKRATEFQLEMGLTRDRGRR